MECESTSKLDVAGQLWQTPLECLTHCGAPPHGTRSGLRGWQAEGQRWVGRETLPRSLQATLAAEHRDASRGWELPLQIYFGFAAMYVNKP